MINPYYQDSHVTVYNKSCTDMSELPDESVQMVVTSPPYWGLRKYAGNQDLIWGGDNHHEHEWGSEIIRKDRGTTKGVNAQVGNQINEVSDIETHMGNICSLCGAWRGSYGLEPTPELYVSHSIEILREIRRVLRKDGVVFWNVGDTYFGSGCGTNDYRTPASLSLSKPILYNGPRPQNNRKHEYLKPKDLVLMPFHMAIEAQRDGWWVRSVIIWSKNNPMPESVKDRPTESHEYILLLTKSDRYYWNQESVREVGVCTSAGSAQQDTSITHGMGCGNSGINKAKEKLKEELETIGYTTRNIRSVWTMNTQPYKDAHFATFPEELPERCIKAGSKEGDLVLDPFAGSGTSLWVAKKLGRKAVGYELSTEYCELIINRNRQQVLMTK